MRGVHRGQLPCDGCTCRQGHLLATRNQGPRLKRLLLCLHNFPLADLLQNQGLRGELPNEKPADYMDRHRKGVPLRLGSPAVRGRAPIWAAAVGPPRRRGALVRTRLGAVLGPGCSRRRRTTVRGAGTRRR
ncbi:hypothetical protein J1605_011307 [Eschrichtius robustus]|uniref:Uncharacterized protein n=1 Tax=Eschrichtius robustus TaxID=9764 RepID=A0AB34GMR0_ESCRO|nr:hypothetical protein J1605_011307 [Eschrichtius robustus]